MPVPGQRVLRQEVEDELDDVADIEIVGGDDEKELLLVLDSENEHKTRTRILARLPPWTNHEREDFGYVLTFDETLYENAHSEMEWR